jgi:DNA-binding transcriptional regulator YiaG
MEAHLRLLSTLPSRVHVKSEPVPKPTGRAGQIPKWKVNRMRQLEKSGLSRKKIAAALHVSHRSVRNKLGRKRCR